jgi:hypothetical protein
MRPHVFVLAAAFALLLAAPATAAQQSLYVAPSGSDTASGTSDAPMQSLTAALKRAPAGTQVVLAAGTYPAATDAVPRTGDVTVVGAGTGQTMVAGLTVAGGRHLDVSGITFTGPVQIRGDNVKPAELPAEDIVFHDNEVTTSSTCVTVKANATDVTIADNHLHDCYTGVAGPGNPLQSHSIAIVGNAIENLVADGIQFGNWDDVRIEGNVIRNIRDPKASIHNDGIQLTGSSTDVRIAANRIYDSRHQLIFVQDAIGPIDGVDVINNLTLGAGSVAIQSLGATRARFVNNTSWEAKDGALWIGPGAYRNGTSVVPTDTVVVNNIARILRIFGGVQTPAAAGNVVLCPARYSGVVVPAGARCLSDLGFTDTANRDYTLRPDSAARPLASPMIKPATDVLGLERTELAPGAYR